MTHNLFNHLETLRNASFREITDIVAADLGINFEWTANTVPTGNEARAEQRAQLIIDQWEETVEMQPKPREPATPLEKLLRERHEICELILDIREGRLADEDE